MAEIPPACWSSPRPCRVPLGIPPQAAQILKTPGLADAFTGMNTLTTPENAEKFAFLKDDPELAPVWEEIKTNGPAALQKVRGMIRAG